MPEICRFYGIIIRMFWADHPPPHFHAIYGEYEAVIDIQTSEIIQGQLPRRAHNLVAEWLNLHHDELLEEWALARHSQPLKRIDPLP
jgi:Domain of unknown function (DUF4160)